jgi:hypothetical protein
MTGRVLLVAVLAAACVGGRADGASPAPIPLSAIAADVDAHSPQLALDARGDAFAIWRETTLGGDVTEASIRRAGGDWSPARVLASGVSAQLAVDASGDAVVAGITLGDGCGVFAVYRHAGAPWGRARLLVRSGAACWGGVSVAIHGTGRALVAFEKDNTIEVATPTPGRDHGTWRTRPLGHGILPAVAVDEGGDALVTWHAANAPDAPILAAWEPDGRQWQRPHQLPEPPGEFPDLFVLAAALDDSGDATVLTATWTDRSQRLLAVNVSDARLGGRFSQPQRVGTALYAVGAVLAEAAGGRAVVLFVPGYNDGPLFATTRPAAGQRFGEPAELAQQLSFSPALAITPSGRAVAVWTQSTGWNGSLALDVAAARPDGSFGSPAQLAAIGPDCFAHRCLAGGLGAVALGPGGRGIVAWVAKADPTAATGGVVYARDIDLAVL